jgi:PAS domain S-box-containing protein
VLVGRKETIVRKQASGRAHRPHKALQEFIQFWHATFEALSEGIFLCNKEGRILLCNAALLKLLGKRSAEVIGRPCWEVAHATCRRIGHCPAVRMRKSGLKERLVWQMGDRWLETVVDAMREDGRVTGYVHFIFDVTDRVQTQQRLEDNAKKLKQMMDGSIWAIASTLELRDPYTAGHQRRVAQLACAMAVEMGMPEDRVEGLRIACYVHDIGKIAVPAEILAKPSTISDHERGIIKTHPQFGADVLKKIDFIWPVAEATLQHHERLDGSGYPNRLKGEKIILEARILAVADVVEAMCSHRPYRPALGIVKALQEIAGGRGTQYDAKAVDACIKLFRKKHFQSKWRTADLPADA